MFSHTFFLIALSFTGIHALWQVNYNGPNCSYAALVSATNLIITGETCFSETCRCFNGMYCSWYTCENITYPDYFRIPDHHIGQYEMYSCTGANSVPHKMRSGVPGCTVIDPSTTSPSYKYECMPDGSLTRGYYQRPGCFANSLSFECSYPTGCTQPKNVQCAAFVGYTRNSCPQGVTTALGTTLFPSTTPPSSTASLVSACFLLFSGVCALAFFL